MRGAREMRYTNNGQRYLVSIRLFVPLIQQGVSELQNILLSNKIKK